MPRLATVPTRTATALALAVSAVAASPAHAAPAPAAATVTDCKDDHLTVVGRVSLGGSAARKARGAALEIQFQALQLFGLPRTGDWHPAGKGTTGGGRESFTGLVAGGWTGLMHWRFRKGGRVVLAGDERSQPGRAGIAAGRAYCVLREGAKPRDETPPMIAILPADEVWHRGPTQVAVGARDDLSGVKAVRYSLDGGPAADIRNGGTFTIETEGAHAVSVTATDVAGNSATRTLTILVDRSAPAKPALQKPMSVTVSTTPNFQWTASSDSGSGLKGYVLAIKRASDGSLVSLTPYDAGTTSANSPQPLVDGQTYTAIVTAVDKTDTPFTTDSDPLTFTVDTHPKLTASDPLPGAIISGSRKSGNIKLTLDRAADPATVVKGSTVVLQAQASSGPTPDYAVSCSDPCSTITVQPSITLPEGRYTVTMNGVKSLEGAVFPSYQLKFTAAFDPTATSATVTNSTCLTDAVNTTMAYSLTSATSEAITVSFDWSVGGTGNGQVQIRDNATTVVAYGPVHPPGSGHDVVQATLGATATHNLVFELHATCSPPNPVTFSVSNLVASRTP